MQIATENDVKNCKKIFVFYFMQIATENDINNLDLYENEL